MHVIPETSVIPPLADGIVSDFIARVTALEKGLVTGIYLTGSTALRDFHPGKSDIDFMVLCREVPGAAIRRQLNQLHRSVQRRFKTGLNGYYISSEALDAQYSGAAKMLYYNAGKLSPSIFDMAPIALYELKTTGITLYGIPAERLPVMVDENILNAFLHANINFYWRNWIDGPQKILLVLFPRLTEWVILGVARQLYTLQTGKIASKTQAGSYCLEQLPKKLHPIIYEAISIRQDRKKHLFNLKNSYYLQPSISRAAATINCARYIIDTFNNAYGKQSGAII